MKSSHKALLTAGLLLGIAGPALAQTVGVAVGVAPEERTRIKQYIVQERVAPVTVKERVTVGAKLPADIELRSVPGAWGPNLTKYRYVYSDNHVYLVEPSSREVVEVIE